MVLVEGIIRLWIEVRYVYDAWGSQYGEVDYGRRDDGVGERSGWEVCQHIMMAHWAAFSPNRRDQFGQGVHRSA